MSARFPRAGDHQSLAAQAEPASRCFGISAGGAGSAHRRTVERALYQYTIQSDNVQDLSHWGPILLAGMQKLPGFQDVSSDAQNSGLQELLTYDRPTAARLGITPPSLDSALYGAFGQSEVSLIYTQLNQYYVVLEVAPPYWQSPEGLKNIYLNTTGNGVDSAFHGHHGAGKHHAADHQSHQFVPIRHRVVQSCHGYVVERRHARG